MTKEEQIAALEQLFSGGLGALTPELFGDGGEGSGYQVGYRTPDTLYPLMQQARSILEANWNDPTLQWVSKLQGSNVVSGLSRAWDDSAGYGDWLLGAGDDATAPQRFSTVDELAAALAPGGASVSLPAMDDPSRPGKQMQYVVSFNPDGSLNNVDWRNVELSGGWLSENGWMIPLVAAAAGFAGLGAGGASAAPTAQGGGYFGGLSAGAGGQTGLTLGGGQGLVATQAPSVAQTGVLGSIVGPTGTSGIAESLRTAYDAVKPYASLIGPATSLIGAATAQTPQMPQNAGARIPGVEAPPEARGYQPASAPILDVLGRNRRSNRNPTLLTGPGGVNMDSVRVGGNTLLGM